MWDDRSKLVVTECNCTVFFPLGKMSPGDEFPQCSDHLQIQDEVSPEDERSGLQKKSLNFDLISDSDVTDEVKISKAEASEDDPPTKILEKVLDEFR